MAPMWMADLSGSVKRRIASDQAAAGVGALAGTEKDLRWHGSRSKRAGSDAALPAHDSIGQVGSIACWLGVTVEVHPHVPYGSAAEN
jgi:hypothetical protein